MITITQKRKFNKPFINLITVLSLFLIVPIKISTNLLIPNFVQNIEDRPVECYATVESLKKETEELKVEFNLYQKCIWFLKVSESLRLEKYRCPANRLTIGWGHLIRKGESFTTLTVKEADELFKQDFNKFWEYVSNRYPHFEKEQQWAITLFVFNLGEGNLEGSNLDKYLLAGDYKNAARQILKFNKARRHKKTCSANCKKCRLRVFRGLNKKRKFEAALLLKDYDYIQKATETVQEDVMIKIRKALNLLK